MKIKSRNTLKGLDVLGAEVRHPHRPQARLSVLGSDPQPDGGGHFFRDAAVGALLGVFAVRPAARWGYNKAKEKLTWLP